MEGPARVQVIFLLWLVLGWCNKKCRTDVKAVQKRRRCVHYFPKKATPEGCLLKVRSVFLATAYQQS